MAETKEFLLSEEQYHRLISILAEYCYDHKDKDMYTLLISLQLQAVGYRWV